MHRKRTTNRIAAPILPEVRFQLAENYAKLILKEMGFPQPPMPLTEFVQKRKWLLHYDELYGPDGYMLKVEGKKTSKLSFALVIATDNHDKKYSKITHERHQYWTFAHEIGHALLHGEYISTSRKDGFMKIDKFSEENMEVEAHFFASRLLLPNYVFTGPEHLLPEALAERCLVNIDAAQRRLKNLDKRIIKKLTKNSSNVIAFPSVVHVHTNPTNHKGETIVTEKYDYYPSDSNGRFVNCIICENFHFSDDAAYCKMCGSYLFNSCTVCNKRNPPDARFCEHCSEPTELHKRDLIKTMDDLFAEYGEIWKGIKEETEKGSEKEKPIDISDDDLPF